MNNSIQSLRLLRQKSPAVEAPLAEAMVARSGVTLQAAGRRLSWPLDGAGEAFVAVAVLVMGGRGLLSQSPPAVSQYPRQAKLWRARSRLYRSRFFK